MSDGREERDRPAGRIRDTYRRLAAFLARSLARLRSGYRPERHYMRGSRTSDAGMGKADPKAGRR